MESSTDGSNYEPSQTNYYVQALIKKAKEKLEADENPIFDMQGAYLCDIKKEELESPNGIDPEIWVNLLKDKNLITTISLNVVRDDGNKFLVKINQSNDQSGIEANEQRPLLQSGRNDFLTQASGSINPIVREFYFHFSGVSKLLSEALSEDKAEQIEKAYIQTMQQVSNVLIEEYNKILVNTTKITDPDERMIAINQQLDRLREDYLQDAYKKFFQKLHINKVELTEKEVDALIDGLPHTVGSDHDILYVNGNSAMFAYSNQGHDSHTKDDPDKIGMVKKEYFSINGDEVKADKSPTNHSTVHSIAPKHSYLIGVLYALMSIVPFIPKTYGRKKCINDTKEKIDKMANTFGDNNTKPIVYNLYTSLPNWNLLGWIDEKNNHQSQSAYYILMGAHAHNKELIAGRSSEYFYVQNIPVNGHGAPLGYYNGLLFSSSLVSEATLMTEMALMNTLCEDGNENLEGVIKEYNKFLSIPDWRRPNYFSSYLFANPRHYVKQFKESIKDKPPSDTDDVVTIAKECLELLTAHDRYYRNDATLFQALSGFVEINSFAGCKSSIDRTPMVENRIAVLKRVLNEDVGTDGPLFNVQQALINLAKLEGDDRKNITKVKEKESELEEALNKATNILEAQAGAVMEANARSGGAPKYEIKKPVPKWWEHNTLGGINLDFLIVPLIVRQAYNFFNVISNFKSYIINLNTNMAENSEMTTVSQSQAQQLHNKGLGKIIRDAYKAESVPKNLNKVVSSDMVISEAACATNPNPNLAQNPDSVLATNPNPNLAQNPDSVLASNPNPKPDPDSDPNTSIDVNYN